MGIVSIYCLARQESTDSLYVVSYGYPKNSNRSYFLLLKSNPSPKSARDIRWTLMEAKPEDELPQSIRYDSESTFCSVDSMGKVTLLSMLMNRYNMAQLVPVGTTINSTYTTKESVWESAVVSEDFRADEFSSILFNVPQLDGSSALFHASTSGDSIVFNCLNPTTRTFEASPVLWKMPSDVKPWRIAYSDATVFILSTTVEKITLTKVPVNLTHCNVPPMPSSSPTYSWDIGPGYRLADLPGTISSVGQSLYGFFVTEQEVGLGAKDTLMIFNGTHALDLIRMDAPVGKSHLSLGRAIAVAGGADGPFIAMNEMEIRGAMLSSISLNQNNAGAYTKGYYVNITDDYTSPPLDGSSPTDVTSPTPSPSPSTLSSTGSSLAAGAIAGIVVGALVVVALVGMLVFRRWRSRSVTRDNESSQSGDQKQPENDYVESNKIEGDPDKVAIEEQYESQAIPPSSKDNELSVLVVDRSPRTAELADSQTVGMIPEQNPHNQLSGPDNGFGDLSPTDVEVEDWVPKPFDPLMSTNPQASPRQG